MSLITKDHIAELAEKHDAFCMSIFIPTHRYGQDTLHKADAVALKNQLKEVIGKLEKEGLSLKEILRKVEPIQELIEDGGFWRRQLNGLAVFLADGIFRHFSVPVPFEPFNYVGNDFYLKPLMPMFHGDGRFFVLALELEHVKFYRATRFAIKEIHVEDLIPARLEEVVGYDYENKSIHYRTKKMGGQGPAFSFMGHGEGENERKDEILRYFRAIDKGLKTILHSEMAPLVVASQDYLFPIYKEANTYQYLWDKPLTVNLAVADMNDLHEMAWNIIQPYFEREQLDKIALFEQFHDTGRTSTEVEDILPAAIAGTVEALFLQNKTDIFGIYDPANGEVEIQQEHQIPGVSLMNLMAVRTFLQGGKVYLMDQEAMPAPYAKVNALYRF